MGSAYCPLLSCTPAYALVYIRYIKKYILYFIYYVFFIFYIYKSHCVWRNADLHAPCVLVGPPHCHPNSPLHCHAPSLFSQRLNSSFLEMMHTHTKPHLYSAQTALSGSQGTSSAFSHALYQRGLSLRALVPHVSKGEACLQRWQPHFALSSPVCASNTGLFLVQKLP